MSAGPTISVVIPTYNRGQWIAGAIESALAQTHSDFEVLVIDDGSTDSTAAVVEPFTRRGPVRYLAQENRGVAAARNRGIREARGPLVAFLDSDDHWYPWKLEMQARLFAKLPELALVCTDFGAATDEGVHTSSYIQSYYKIFRRLGIRYSDMFAHHGSLGELAGGLPGVPADARVYWGNVFEWLFQGNFIHTFTVLVRRDVLLAAGGFDESFRTQEDVDLYLRITRRHPVALVDVPSGRYTMHSNDRLSGDRHLIAIKENIYRSLSRVVAEVPELTRDRPALVRKRMGAVTYELGTTLLAAGESSRARGALLESLRHRPANPAAWAALILALLPGNGWGRYRRLRERRSRSEGMSAR